MHAFSRQHTNYLTQWIEGSLFLATHQDLWKKFCRETFPAMYSPVSTRQCISLPLYYILPSWTRRYNRGLINLLPYNILKLFLVCECKSTHYSLKNNTLCEKYELIRRKKSWLTKKKEHPLANAKRHSQGDWKFFIEKVSCRKKLCKRTTDQESCS